MIMWRTGSGTAHTISLSFTRQPSVYTASKLLMWHINLFVGWQKMCSFDKEGMKYYFMTDLVSGFVANVQLKKK